MLQNREGQRVPDVTFRTRENDHWKDVTTGEIFGGKTVACFALPGAFTPTCSSTHLPRYEELAAALRAAGVDDIVCVAVNDAFVMEAWGRDQHVRAVRLIADGNGAFTEQMGMLVDKTDLGFGKRSWRYAMLVRDGVIERMFIEPERDGDPFEVSDADTMLHHLDPTAVAPTDVTLFTTPGCPHCARAKRMLDEHGTAYEEIVLANGVTRRSLRAVTGADTVPQIFIDGRRIGSADDLARHLDAA
jgi:glutaredoxin-like protein